MAKDIMFVINPRSGRGEGRRLIKKLKSFVVKASRAGKETAIFQTEKEGLLTSFNLARTAVFENYRFLVVAGGDGTQNEAAHGLLCGMKEKEAPLEEAPAMIPLQLGSANDWARNLGVISDTNFILDFLCQKEDLIRDWIIPVDVGLITWPGGQKIFLNVFSFGRDAEVNRLAAFLKEKLQIVSFLPFLGRGVYYLAVLAKLVFQPKFDFPEVKLEMNDQSSVDRITMVAFGIGSCYGGHFKVAPEASFQDGLLDICQVSAMDYLKTLKCLSLILKGEHLFLPEVKTTKDRKLPKVGLIKVYSSQPLICQADGENLPCLREFKVEILPSRLKILIPNALKPVSVQGFSLGL